MKMNPEMSKIIVRLADVSFSIGCPSSHSLDDISFEEIGDNPY
jgi:hypothetical protein